MTFAGGAEADDHVARLVLKYLSRNPDAKDTREGIATWWLRQQQIDDAIQTVHRALDLLVQRGLIVEHRAPDHRSYFTINHERLDEVARFLGEPERRRE